MSNESLDASLNRRVFPRFLAYALGFLLILSLISGLFYVQKIDGEKKQIAIEQKNHLVIHANSMSYNLKQLGYALLFLVDQVRLHQPFEEPEGREIFADDMISFLQTTELFDQLRLLDTRGMELVRANYNDGHPSLTPENELQNKRDRYYVRDTLRLDANQVYISPLDLNIENGKVEIPYKPTIRFGMPVFNAKGGKKGILILNFLAERMLARLRNGNDDFPGRIMLLNREGYWLYGTDPDKQWGFMFEDRRHETMAKHSPAEWQRVLGTDSGDFEEHGKLYAFATIYPFREMAEIPMIQLATDSSHYFWKLVSDVPGSVIAERARMVRHSILLWSAPIACFLLLIAWLLARSDVRRIESESRLRYIAQHDKLTGLASRELFSDRLEQAMAMARRHHSSFAVLYLDLDEFKPINDQYGHDAGDALLQNVADRLHHCVREVDTVARIGGDEFAIILVETETAADAELVAEKMIQVFNTKFRINGCDCRISASIGIAVYPSDSEHAEDLVRCADKAMYRAKLAGKNSYCLAQAIDKE
ncbi:MAG: diguanylate cyclase domain-containing protein [Mariprofundus sp.]